MSNTNNTQWQERRALLEKKAKQHEEDLKSTMSQTTIDYSKPQTWELHSELFPSFEALKEFCDRFPDPSPELALTKFLTEVRAIADAELASGKRLQMNWTRSSYGWKHEAEHYSDRLGKHEYVSNTCFTIAAVKFGFVAKSPKDGTNSINWYFNFPRNLEKKLGQSRR